MYPYGHGETFLTQELEELSSQFETVFIIPNHNHQVIRKLPENVELINIEFDNNASLSSTFKNNPRLLFIFLFEIVFSKHRFTYIRQFKQYLINIAIANSHSRSLRNKINIQENDVLYSYWLNDWAMKLAILKKWYFKKNHLVSRIHGYDFDEIQTNNVFHPFRHFILSQYDKIVSVSDYGKQYVQKKYPRLNNKIFTSHLGNKSQQIITNKQDNYIVVSCSNIIQLKRLDIIIEILKYIKLPITWIHFGSGELETFLKKQTEKLPDNIKIDWKGQTKNDKILEFYSQNTVSLFVNTSDYEGLPYSMIEAINFGIPLCGRNICGIPEIVNDQTGILLNSELNFQKSAEIISDFLIHKSHNLEFRKKVKEHFELHFNAEINYQNFVKQHLKS